MKNLPTILKMSPYYRPVVWGGRRLETALNKELPEGENIGESFEVSALPDMESVVESGPLAGQNVRELYAAYGGELAGKGVVSRYGEEFPLLIKLLDANDDLSIQVHPDDTYARQHKLGTFGKMEAWYVVRSDDGRLASGLRSGVDRIDLIDAIDRGKVEDVVEFYSVKEGDIVFLKPGSVHALCRGVMVYEVQQSSSLTFRLYDYNRPDTDGNPRQLNLNQALDVINFGEPAIIPAPVDTPTAVESEHFILEQFSSEDTEHNACGSFRCVTVISGSAELNAEDSSVALDLAETALIHANRTFSVTTSSDARYLISSVPV